MENINQDELFLARVIEEAIDLEFGQISFNVIIKNNKPLIHTINVVRSKRIKFPYTLDKVT